MNIKELSSEVADALVIGGAGEFKVEPSQVSVVGAKVRIERVTAKVLKTIDANERLRLVGISTDADGLFMLIEPAAE